MDRTSQGQTYVLTRSTRDGSFLRAAVGVLIGSVVFFAWHKKTAGSFELSANTYFFAGLSAFIVVFLLATLWQYAFPVFYTATITSDSVTFERSNRDLPDIAISREDVVRLHRAMPPWYARKTAHLYSYAFELTDDRWYVINYRFVHAGNRSSFADAIERLWHLSSLSDAPVCRRLMNR